MKLLKDFFHCSDASVNSAGCVLVFEYIDKLLCLNLLIQRVRLMANVLTLLQSGLRNEKSRLKSLITLSCLHSFVRLLVTDTLAQTWKLTWHKLVPLSWSHTCTHGCALSLPLFISLSCYLKLFFSSSCVFLFTLPHSLSPSHTLSAAVSPFPSPPLSRCLSVFHSLLTVKPFHGLLLLKHQKLPCQMHRGREERILFTVNQKTRA